MLISAIAFGVVIVLLVSISEARVLRYKNWHNAIQKEHEKRNEMVEDLIKETDKIAEDCDALYAMAAVTFGEENVDGLVVQVKEARREKRNG